MDKRDSGIVEIIKILIQWRAEGFVRFTILTPPFNKRSRVVSFRCVFYRQEEGCLFSVRGWIHPPLVSTNPLKSPKSIKINKLTREARKRNNFLTHMASHEMKTD